MREGPREEVPPRARGNAVAARGDSARSVPAWQAVRHPRASIWLFPRAKRGGADSPCRSDVRIKKKKNTSEVLSMGSA